MTVTKTCASRRFPDKRTSVTVTIVSRGSSSSYPTIWEISSRRMSATLSGRRMTKTGAGGRRSRQGTASLIRTPADCLLQFRGCYFLYNIGLDLITDLEVVKVFQTSTTLESFAYFCNVIFKPAQRGDIAFPADDAVSDQTRARATPDVAIDNHRSTDDPRLRYPEYLAHICPADNLLFLDCFEHADHSRANFFLNFIDDRVQPDIDAFLFRQISCPGARPDIETNYHHCRNGRTGLS